MTENPPFGQADLTNCERELIHLPGSIQPHGILFVLAEPNLVVLSCSANTEAVIGFAPEQLLGQQLNHLSEALHKRIVALTHSESLIESAPVRATITVNGEALTLDCALHRSACQRLILECLLSHSEPASANVFGMPEEQLVDLLSDSVDTFSQAASIGTLCNAAAKIFRDLSGFDRVMAYKFDSDGHGEIIAEARDPRLESLLGHRYPASDIPQRARELYISNRVRVLVDATDAQAPLVSDDPAFQATELDMSMCYLRSMSPLHLQYLQNMGVTATLVVSLVRNGELWGLIAAHHYQARNISFAVRAGAQLLGEAMSTRISAIENYAKARVAIQVRRLEQRLIEATSAEGDWTLALFGNPGALLRPLEAGGAALFFDNKVQTAGDVPSTPELRALVTWIDSQVEDGQYSCNSISSVNPKLASLTPLASGILAIKLSSDEPDYLVWFRKEQLQSVTWAGDPTKPVIGNDPNDLSPRRSFAAWSEQVRGTALPWTSGDLALANAIGASLIDIIVQVHGVQMLIAEKHLSGVRHAIDSSTEPVIVFNSVQKTLYCNRAFETLTTHTAREVSSFNQFAELFVTPDAISDIEASLQGVRRAWHGELALSVSNGSALPVRVRIDLVSDAAGTSIGMVATMVDLSTRENAQRARLALQKSLDQAQQDDQQAMQVSPLGDSVASSRLRAAIVTNASMAAMDIADAMLDKSSAPIFEEVKTSAQRAAQLERWINASFRDVTPEPKKPDAK